LEEVADELSPAPFSMESWNWKKFTASPTVR